MATKETIEELFMAPIRERNITLHMIAGNHDTYYKNTNRINTLKALYENDGYPNLHLYWEKPVELEFDGLQVMLCPWICDENQEISLDMMRNTRAKVLMGHFEINGFRWNTTHVQTGTSQ